MLRVIILILLSGTVLAQNHLDIEGHINKLIARGDETNNLSLYDLLIYYYDNPINLNKANKDDLLQLGILNEIQVDEILEHRKNTGDYQSIYELQGLNSLSIEAIKDLLPFVVVPTKSGLVDRFKELGSIGTNYSTFSFGRLLEDVRGFREGVYLGSPEKAQMRWRIRNPGKLSIGLAVQKDPGEPWLHHRNMAYPDYLTGHIFLENLGHIKELAVGDYRLQFGQGLVLGAGFMAGKNAETVTTVKQQTVGLLPYSSVTEAGFFRGLAMTLRPIRNVKLSLFYSNQHLDATPDSDNSNNVTSIRTSGLHRTSAEIMAMDQLHEQVLGAALYYENDQFTLGGLVAHTHFNKYINPSAQAYNQHRFRGQQLTNFSLFGEYRLNNFTLFGELAKSEHAGLAVNSGILGQISRYAGLSLAVRYLEKDFHSLHGRSFTERNVLGNENGIYWGLKLHPSKNISVASYFDIYRFPWMTSSSAAPASGKDIMVRLEYKLSKVNKAFIQVRSEQVESALPAVPVKQTGTSKITKGIVNFDFATTATLSFRSRMQYNRFDQKESGVLILQDINYNSIKFGMSGRVLLFDTESFNTRQYVYERDMLFTYNTRAFYGKGVSYYLIVKYKPLRALSLRAKISYTEHLGVNQIGSGYNLIDGNARTQVTGQLHYKF